MLLRNSSEKAVKNARRLRNEPSESETLLWNALRRKQIGFIVRRQVPVGPYVLDFFVHEARLCIEVDGEQHAYRVQSDQTRDEYLAALAIETLRIPSWELFENRDAWVNTIYVKCCERTGRDPNS